MDESAAGSFFLAFIVVQRLSELLLARANTARLLARGGREVGAAHYPLIVGLHGAWIGSLLVLGYGQPVSGFWLAVFLILQVLRGWILISLGRRWTTRIIVLDEPLVTRGPYRFVRHPNYMLVAAEIFTAPMVLGLLPTALFFTALNAFVLHVRIRAENAALDEARRISGP